MISRPSTVIANAAPESVKAETMELFPVTSEPSLGSTVTPTGLLIESAKPDDCTACSPPLSVGSGGTAANYVTDASSFVNGVSTDIRDVNDVDLAGVSDDVSVVNAGQSDTYASMTPVLPRPLPLTVSPTPAPLQPSSQAGTQPSVDFDGAESFLSRSTAMKPTSLPPSSLSYDEAGQGDESDGDSPSLFGPAAESCLGSSGTTTVVVSALQASFSSQAFSLLPSRPEGKPAKSQEAKKYQLCPCACAHQNRRTIRANDSQSLASALQSLHRELHVPRDQLSSTRRSKTSAPDFRKSSVTTGIVGMSMLGLLGLFLFAADVLSVVSFLYNVVTKRHRVESS